MISLLLFLIDLPMSADQIETAEIVCFMNNSVADPVKTPGGFVIGVRCVEVGQ